nr:MAG TPA_asm: Primosomal protein N' [Caudoviricetes sp.]
MNETYCSLCGSKIISTCPSCNSPLRGDYYANKAHYRYGAITFDGHGQKILSGFNEELQSHQTQIPAYCYNCGKPYPWTEARLKAAENIIDMIDELSEEQKQKLVEFIPDLLIETPRSEYAALICAKFLDGISGYVFQAFKDWCQKNVLPTLLVLMNFDK